MSAPGVLKLQGAFKKESGSLAIGQSFDREYFLTVRIKNTSDKLLTRTRIVEEGRACPPDTNSWLEGSHSSNFPGGYPSPMP